ncbi:MAG TPA: hypothetical protein VLT88_02830, partial [Desulfosarcina sp.]|nr:hypothetical protein [Desulfosarcina sp.]
DRRGLYGHVTVSDGGASAESVFRVMATDGIVGHSPEQTLQNIGTLSTQGMVETDRTILKIMPDRKFEGV